MFSNMPAGLFFVLKYFSFSFNLHLAYSYTHLKLNNLFGPFDNVILEFNCVCVFFSSCGTAT